MTSSEHDLDAGFDPPELDLQSVSSTTDERTIATQRGRASCSVIAPGLHTFEASDHVVYVGLEAAPGVCASLGGAKAERYDAAAGSIIVKPAHLEARLRLSKARESAIIVYPDDSLKELARQQFGPVETELMPPPLGTRDFNALRIAKLLKAELTKKEGVSHVHIEQLIAIMGIHVLYAYASRTSRPEQFKGGLSRQSARKLQEFLSINLTRKKGDRIAHVEIPAGQCSGDARLDGDGHRGFVSRCDFKAARRRDFAPGKLSRLEPDLSKQHINGNVRCLPATDAAERPAGPGC
ncbi:hypothetical protein [Mesorhizobium sp. B1-1-1]|uniref:hypothetical protein n=1 Tax=Mesorhizobium sp. B1-1-1 TaxID=2589983 RepID=UPI001FEE724D|nr:hypothetical protein [Mesorhizobium sp. B1-1-1]